MLAVDREWYLHRDANDRLRSQTLALLEAFHAENPLRSGISREELRSRAGHAQERVFAQLLGALETEGGGQERAGPGPPGLPRDPPEPGAGAGGQRARGRLPRAAARRPRVRRRRSAGTGSRAPRSTSSSRCWSRIGRWCGSRSRSSSTPTPCACVQDQLVALLRQKKEIGPADFKDLFGVSRKFAIPLMEYFDAQRVTVRVGERRVLREGYGRVDNPGTGA